MPFARRDRRLVPLAGLLTLFARLVATPRQVVLPPARPTSCSSSPMTWAIPTTVSWDTLRIRTPHARLPGKQERDVSPGIRARAAYSAPSLTSILTGRYPHQHKITSNDPLLPLARSTRAAQRVCPSVPGRSAERMIKFFDEMQTLPRLLTSKGFLSLRRASGGAGRLFRRGGFTHGMTHGDPNRGGRHGDLGLSIGRSGMQPVFDFINVARGVRKAPLFLWYAAR